MGEGNKYRHSGARILWCRAAGDRDLSATAADELLGNPEADAGAKDPFGGEKGLEYAR